MLPHVVRHATIDHGICHTCQLTNSVCFLCAGSYLLELFGADDAAPQAGIAALAAAELAATPAEVPAGGRQKFRLPAGARLAAVLRSVEGARASLGIQSYSLSQPTLEQVFERSAELPC